MTPTRIAGIILLVLGFAGFAAGGFSYNRETTSAQLGPLQLQVQKKETMDIPPWLSIGTMVVGGLLLGLSLKRP